VSNEGGGATLHAPSSGRGCSAAWVGTGGDVGLSFATSALEVATDAGAEVSVVQQLPILDDQTPDEIFGAFESHLSSSWRPPPSRVTPKVWMPRELLVGANERLPFEG
jgi:hypothetical protein